MDFYINNIPGMDFFTKDLPSLNNKNLPGMFLFSKGYTQFIPVIDFYNKDMSIIQGHAYIYILNFIFVYTRHSY
jgi:hypothetical protein